MPNPPLSSKFIEKEAIRGTWTPQEDQKLAQFIQLYGPRRWSSIAAKSGLNRSGKSCRLRWMNYLRPNIKRGNTSNQGEDLILRLHKLLGNRWSLIARRLPGRTDNEIKNYWNSHLSKKMKQNEKLVSEESTTSSEESEKTEVVKQMNNSNEVAKGREEEEEDPLNFELDQTWLDLL